MSFLIDAALSPQTAAYLISNGHDAIHVEQLGLLQASDEEILQKAADLRRVIITMDLDFPKILAFQGRYFPGVILLRLNFATPGHIHERLSSFLSQKDLTVLTNAVTVIEDTRIRMRKLPL